MENYSMKRGKSKNGQLFKKLKNKNADVLEAKLVNKKDLKYWVDAWRNMPFPGVENYTRYTISRLGMHELFSSQQLKPNSGPVINDVLSFKYRYNVAHCQSVKVKRRIFIAVMSSTKNFEKRQNIRQTWLNQLKKMKPAGMFGLSGFAFVLGLPQNNKTQSDIDEENLVNGDIIQMEISDTYRNLSLKSIGLLYWLYINCANVDYVLKVDDDIYINVRNLVNFLQSYPPSNKSLFGTSAAPFIPFRGNYKSRIQKFEIIIFIN